jgi:cytoskeletal protein CcmA (bactofilin family)
MFGKKTEESEWTRFSRALGGQQPAPSDAEQTRDDEPDEALTISQAAPAETDSYPPPPPPAREPEPVEPPAPAYSPAQPTVATPAFTATANRGNVIEDAETVVGDGATIEGTVRSDRSIRVFGTIQGEVESKQRVVVEESAKVSARISAEQVTVLGQVDGSIECSGRLEIASSARVAGDVAAATLVIQEGAVVEGNLRMSSASITSVPRNDA